MDSFGLKTKKEKEDFAIAIVVILVVLSGILYAIFWPKSASDQAVSEEMLVATTAPIQKTEDPRSEQDMFVEKSDPQADQSIDPAITKAEPERPYPVEEEAKTPLRNIEKTIDDSDLGSEVVKQKKEVDELAAEIGEVVKEEAETLSAEEDLKNSEDTQGAVIEEDPAESTVEPEPKAEAQADSGSDANSETQKTCLIVVGAFAKESNIQNLSRKLEEDGFKVIRGQYRGNTKISIETSCDRNQQDDLDLIRKKYAKDAFFQSF